MAENLGVKIEAMLKKNKQTSLTNVTKTGNGERGTGNGERGTGNGEDCTAVTRLRIQNGGGNDVYKH